MFREEMTSVFLDVFPYTEMVSRACTGLGVAWKKDSHISCLLIKISLIPSKQATGRKGLLLLKTCSFSLLHILTFGFTIVPFF